MSIQSVAWRDRKGAEAGRMVEHLEKPVVIGIVSAGPTAALDEPARSLALSVIDRADLGPTTLPADMGLIHFAALMAAARSKMGGVRPIGFVVRGAADTRARVLTAFEQLVEAGADLILFWTVSPLALPGPPEGDAAFDAIMATAVARDTVVIFPAATGFGARCPGMVGCGAAIATAPYLDAAAVPAGWPDPVPEVTSWADWASFRAAWLGAGLVEGMPEAAPFPTGQCLPVWTVAAILLLLACRREGRLTQADVVSALETMAVPVSIRPARVTPRLGFLDPRIMDAVSMTGHAAARAAHS
jgi:hypothetical protein